MKIGELRRECSLEVAMDDHRIGELLAIFRGGSDISDARWKTIEASLGLRLPGSYKKLIDLYGASRWRDFLQVLSPFDDAAGLVQIGMQELEADRITRSSFKHYYPFPLFPEPNGLLPWAITDNGDVFYFITAHKPDDWPTLIKGPRAPEFEVSFLPPALLVHHFAVGSLRSTILPTKE
jgi:hypothetical protein